MASGVPGKSLGGSVSRLALAAGLVAAVSSVSQAQQATGPIQIGTSFDCTRIGTGQSIPALVCQTPELQFADLHQMQAYYTLRHAQPQRQQELRNQFTSRIQALVRECSTEQVRASGSQPACVTQALGNLRGFWLEQLQQTGNAAALEEARLPSGNFVGAQQALRTSGFLPANAVVDGVYGSGTREAIVRFQAERGIASNGFLTQTTLAALRLASITGAGTAGAPVAVSSAAATVAQQPPAGSTNQTAQAQPAPRTQANPPSNPQQTSPRSAATPAPTGAPTEEQLATAQRALDARDYQTALRIYRPLAEQGVPAAQGGMARLFLNGWGVERNEAEALRWARLGAAQNDPTSQAGLGFMYMHGRGTSRDDAEAVRWLRMAADQGSAIAQNGLGFAFMNGRGVRRDDAEAVRWLRMAAIQQHTGAQSNLGIMYEQGRGVARDIVEARRLYAAAAAAGDSGARENLERLGGSAPSATSPAAAPATQQQQGQRQTGEVQRPPHASPYLIHISPGYASHFGIRNPAAIGTIASTQEICAIFHHPIFQHGSDLLRVVIPVSSKINWDTNNIGLDWLSQNISSQIFHQARRDWRPDPATIDVLINRKSECFNSIYQRNQAIFDLIFYFWGQPGRGCAANRLAICPSDFMARDLTAQHTQAERFRIMLALREAHPALISALDRLNTGVEEGVRAVVALERRRQQERQASADAEQARSAQFRENLQNYRARQKSILEQVLNYTSTGSLEGSDFEFWVSGHGGSHRCILTQFSRSAIRIDPVDIRSINQTSTRLSPPNANHPGTILISDAERFRMVCSGCDMERLRNAWSLAFQECPGRRSAF